MTNHGANSRAKRHVGVIQGRLSPRPPERLQAFPHETWEQEFPLARRLGFDGIEWIFEAPRAHENPLRSPKGRARIRKVIEQSGTPVLSVCGDYFMVHRLSEPGEEGERASRILSEVIAQSAAIGAKRILLPWLEEAALDTEDKRKSALANLTRALVAAERHQIMLGLEMEVPAVEYAGIVSAANHPLVRAYYDTGNSTAQGIDIGQDIVQMSHLLGAVHVKDRITHGGSQFLGEGDTNFADFFAHLDKQGFSGDLVLQHFFEEPERDARQALAFIRKHWAGELAA